MTRLLAATALALSIGAAGCVRGRPTPAEPLVDEVDFRGVSAVDEDDLAEGLATVGPLPRPGLSGEILRDRQRFDPDALETDRRRIAAFYRERGYYQVEVREPTVEELAPGLVKVVFRVSEGRPARVGELRIDGLEDAPEAARRIARLELPLAVGDVFTVPAYDAARDAIEEALQNSGWATAEVRQSAHVLPERTVAEVRYEVRPGVRYRFGAIHVGRVAGISSQLIEDEVSAVIRTGEWWDESKLAEAQRRLFELGVFGAVRVTHARPDPARGTIPVVVELRQAKYQTVRAGPGIVFEAARFDAQAQVGWQHRNFLGDLRRLSVDLRAGYAWVPTPFAARKEGPFALLSTEFRQPGAFTKWVDAAARAQVERGVQDAYDFVAERLRLSTPLRIVSRLTLVPSVNVEVYQLSNTEVTFDPTQPGSGSGPLLENCRGNVCLLAYLEQEIAWDARDDRISTRRGWWAGVSVQEGFAVRGYGYRYLRLRPELRAFYPLGRRVVLAARTRVGALIPVGETGDPPLVARFYAGGPQSMRGYYTNRLSPMVLQGSDWVPTGANGAADGSVELRFDLDGPLDAVLFVDGAGVSNASSGPTEYQTALDPTRLQWAGGFGLRYRTPFGPLRVDVAARLPERFDGPVHEWFPQVPYTPHREPIVAVHIALGEAF